MTTWTQDQVMDAMAASLTAALPARYVQRALVDPGVEKAPRLEAGVVCVVSTGGGNFANWTGREGELGTMNVSVVGFVKVADRLTSDATERAELALLEDLLAWCQAVKAEPLDSVYPGAYRQSQQLAHPVGWLALELQVRWI